MTRWTKTLAERFFEKVNKTDTCWIWTGASNHLGYGQIWVTDERRVAMAHRVSVTLHGGSIPKGYDVDHLCRVRACVNPDHLEPVPHSVNMERAPWSAPDFQAAKTHCKRNHEFTKANTLTKTNSSGGISRQCRTCTRESQARYRARRRAVRVA
jgi:hypothetical protein